MCFNLTLSSLIERLQDWRLRAPENISTRKKGRLFVNTTFVGHVQGKVCCPTIRERQEDLGVR